VKKAAKLEMIRPVKQKPLLLLLRCVGSGNLPPTFHPSANPYTLTLQRCRANNMPPPPSAIVDSHVESLGVLIVVSSCARQLRS
jgi:hypothetical protein